MTPEVLTHPPWAQSLSVEQSLTQELLPISTGANSAEGGEHSQQGRRRQGGQQGAQSGSNLSLRGTRVAQSVHMRGAKASAYLRSKAAIFIDISWQWFIYLGF